MEGDRIRFSPDADELKGGIQSFWYNFIAILLRRKWLGRIYEEQHTLFSKWSTLNNEQKKALLALINSM